MHRLITIILTILLSANLVKAQAADTNIKGIVTDNKNQPIPFVNIIWKNNPGVGTITDQDGSFTIPLTNQRDSLQAITLGYQTQTLKIDPQAEIQIIILTPEDKQLNDVSVVARRKSEIISKKSSLKVEKLTTASLEQLPCCHLAASFENTLSVDKSYPDAVTGTEEIRMLGLAGVYTQVLSEELPLARGLSSSFGLYVPGAFLESINISKGIGSVTSGYEGITGQIQLFLKQPENTDRFFLNLYSNSNGASDINLYKGFEMGKKKRWNTILFIHGSSHFGRHDKNKDGFLDIPTGEGYHIAQTIKYTNPGLYRHQLGYRLMYKENQGGQTGFNPKQDKGTTNNYGVGIESRRWEIFSNQMIKLKNLKGVTIGLKNNISHFKRDAFFGLKEYNAREDNFNSILHIEKRWEAMEQKINFGASFMYDKTNESLDSINIDREEIVPGFFSEYSIKPSEKMTIIAGVRLDNHNHYKLLFTPRLHFKYDFSDKSVFRIRAGKGYRTANTIIDNTGLLPSSKTWNLPESTKDLKEEAWSYGASLSHDLSLAGQEFNIELDFNRTEFEDKIITDLERDPSRIYFTKLNGESYANTYQVQITTSPIKQLVVKMAGRYNQVKETYQGLLRDKLFNAKFKGLLTLSYATKYSKWKFNITNQIIGKAKLPLLEGDEFATHSPAFYQLHAQITRKFKHFEIYVAGENITNYTQKNPILGANNPFSSEFDATRIWAPIMGTKLSGGIRLRIK